MGSVEINFISSLAPYTVSFTARFCLVCALQVDPTHLMLQEAAIFFLETHGQFL